MAKTHTHWLSFDTLRLANVRRALSEGRRVLVARVYNHPADMTRVVLEVHSTDAYADLELDVNSLTSPLRRLSRKPANLGRGMTVAGFEGIYGPLT